ncbi:hypothetical protein F965_00073 [Acinetobacter schindleri NIPH 900]|uniref:Uncharacterized protein n=1 Tax=Acinetobacter schindleri NIPH 900 TaxID=1217675 RepID=N8WRJ1_9GAMM|nr:hypothetical protein [Acinetobacter schindleri]ENV14727.1 hypothetical protein F965_00073 [Acinetobacter schindleri NIPH 900]
MNKPVTLEDLGGFEAAVAVFRNMPENSVYRFKRRMICYEALEQLLIEYVKDQYAFDRGDKVIYLSDGVPVDHIIHEVVGHTIDYQGVPRCLVKMSDSGNIYPFYMTQWRLATKPEIRRYRAKCKRVERDQEKNKQEGSSQ